jgi:glycosyltransferase involved in cell wall biosynthesis
MLNNINILQLGSPTGLYGAERWILALIRHLDSSRFETWVGAIKDHVFQEVPLCIEAARFGFQTHVFHSCGRLSFSAVRQLRHFILKKRINILHTHGYKTDLLGLLATAGTSCKIITTPHGWTKKPDLKLLSYEILDRFSFPFFDSVVPLSDDLYEQLSRIPGMNGKLELIKNGVDIDEIDAVQSVSKEIASWKKEEALVIGFTGRLTPGKGLDLLLNAVAQYGQPNWRLAIVGDGEQLPELKSMAQRMGIDRQVRFFGFRPDRLSFLKGFDIFVLPSRSEGIPRCVMEAMAAGVPVVASDVVGCRNLVDGKTTGLLFKPDKPQQLAAALKSIMSDPTLKHTITRNARTCICTHFSAARMAKQYEQLFIRLTNTHNSTTKNIL